MLYLCNTLPTLYSSIDVYSCKESMGKIRQQKENACVEYVNRTSSLCYKDATMEQEEDLSGSLHSLIRLVYRFRLHLV